MKALQYREHLVKTSRLEKLPTSSLRPVLATDILAVERELGAQLPEQYEEFLTEVGVGDEYGGLSVWYHLDITRPGNLLDVNEHLAEDQTNQMKKEGLPPSRYPKDFLAIYDGKDGQVYGFLRSQAARFFPQVNAWDQEGFNLVSVAIDFEHFLDWLSQEKQMIPSNLVAEL